MTSNKKDKTEKDERLIVIAWYPWVENGLSDTLYSESGRLLLLLLLLICYLVYQIINSI